MNNDNSNLGLFISLTSGDYHKFSFIASGGKFVGYQPVIDLFHFASVLMQLDFLEGSCHLPIV